MIDEMGGWLLLIVIVLLVWLAAGIALAAAYHGVKTLYRKAAHAMSKEPQWSCPVCNARTLGACRDDAGKGHPDCPVRKAA